MCAPASTWAIVSRSTRREVAGLHLLGQELAAGRVDALADDHERLVVADDDLARGRADDGAGHASAAFPWVSSWAGGKTGPPSTPPAWMSCASRCLSYSASMRSTSAATSASMSWPQRLLGPAPFLDVVVVGALAGSAGGLVDRDLEARVEHDLALLAPLAGGDLGGDVAPPDDGHRRHGFSALRCTAVRDGRSRLTRGDRGHGRGELAVAGLAVLEGQAQTARGRVGPP